MRSTTRFAWMVLFQVACVGDTPADMQDPTADDDEGDDGGSSEADDDEADDEADDGATSAETGATETGGEDEDPTDPGGTSFILQPDGGPDAEECDIWVNDCPSGEKCTAWVNDGGNAWNATKCVPLDDNPAQPGDPCQADGNGGTGLDDCDVGSLCWNLDETNMGRCVAFCDGSPANPVCNDPATACSFSNDVLALCLPTCDPLTQNCDMGAGEACYLNGNTTEFFCAPDYSGEGGAYGEACDSMFINVCNAGLMCTPSNTVPNCPGASGCCTPFCDVSLGDEECPGAAGGQACIAIYDTGQAPPGYDDVGVCVIPM